MAVSRELKRRIKSVNSTKQITKAMELVSAAKMRKATGATVSGRPFADRLQEMLVHIRSAAELEVSHPLLENHDGDTSLIIAIASDRGLAGAYNTNVIKRSLQFVQDERTAGRKVVAITMGRKIHDAIQKNNIPVLQNYPLSSGVAVFDELNALYEYAIQSYTEKRFNKVYLVYTHFTSMLKQDVVSQQILPITVEAGTEKVATEFLYEPSPEDVLKKLLPYIIEVKLYQAVLESAASEHSARRVAMKSATDNAGSIIERLNLTYNRLRQGAITQEIAEITSGASALQS